MKRNYHAGQGPVFLHMQKHPGIVYTAQSMADEMNLTSPEDVKSVNRAFVSLSDKGDIERVAQGRYMYRKSLAAKAAPTVSVKGSLYEGIGIRKSTGHVIVTDTEGNLYELHEL